MRPWSSIACDEQPFWHAWHVAHSALRLSPKLRNVDGMARPAPSGHRYLQNGRSESIAHVRSVAKNSAYGHERFHTPTRNVVLNGSISASFSAVPIEWNDTARSVANSAYFTHFNRSCQGFGSANCRRARPSLPARRNASSCSPPYGQSQPQKRPRPTKNTPMITNHQNTNTNGS